MKNRIAKACALRVWVDRRSHALAKPCILRGEARPPVLLLREAAKSALLLMPKSSLTCWHDIRGWIPAIDVPLCPVAACPESRAVGTAALALRPEGRRAETELERLQTVVIEDAAASTNVSQPVINRPGDRPPLPPVATPCRMLPRPPITRTGRQSPFINIDLYCVP